MDDFRDVSYNQITGEIPYNIGFLQVATLDGLTHNMLDNIHAYWKRRRVCKIKCKGVCTVDMENVCQQVEERTGGKIIRSQGGVIFLFRGGNYNYRTRPCFPLMLWRPVTPVYPRLVQQVPKGLTLEVAIEMRNKGRNLIPICKLAFLVIRKNGVYTDLVRNVREAFEECELDLVPCVPISFSYEHILICKPTTVREFDLSVSLM
ncbi:hypothetical protein UlMin_019516 [Ulmus minor]